MTRRVIYVVGTLSLICVCLLLVSEIFVPPLPYPKCSIGYFNYEREQEYVVADERQATQIINGQYTNGDSRNEELEALAETFTLASTHGIEVINEGDRLRLRLSAENMFKRSRADIEDERKPALDYISETLKAKGARYVRVEGYVNDEPVFTPQYPNTWYLSSARAVSVAIYLQEKTGLRHTDIAAEGKGPFFPIYEAGSVKNSLIEIIITP